MDCNHFHWLTLFKVLLPLLGYTRDPITKLNLTYRHPRGSRIIITVIYDKVYYNHGPTPL